MEIDLKKLTIKDARHHLDKGDFSAVDLLKASLDLINKEEKEIHSLVEVFDDCLEEAKQADRKIKNGEKGALLGIPFALKDNILIKGKLSTACSKILEGHRAVYDSTVAKKLKESGAVIVGRTNMDEFAMGSSTETSVYGITKNPIDKSRVPGGSSGGSAASLASGFVLGSLGSDTGGSIRQPASFCGVVGFKPSYGSVSRHGLMAMGSSLDVIGPFGKNVEDVELIFNVIKGKDNYDATSFDLEKEKSNFKKVADLRGFIKEIGLGGIEKAVLENYEKTLSSLKNASFEIVEPKTDLSPLKYALATYYIIMPAEVSTNLARFDGVKYGFYKEGENLLEDYLNTRGTGFGKEARRRILLGTYVLSSGYYDAYYSKANKVRGLIKQTFDNLFKEADIVMTPTSPTLPFKIGEKTENPIEMYLADIFTVTANMAGIPAISIPSGWGEKDGVRLPIGIQFISQFGSDFSLLQFGKKFEKELK